MRHRFSAPASARLDKLLAEQTPLSRQKARALVTRGAVRVDGQVKKHPATQVAEGALVEVRTHVAPAKAPPLPERYRDEVLVVVDKPSGLPSQAGREGGARNVYGILSATEPYVGLHHRLDTPASGLLLLTLSRGVNPAVAALFAERSVERRYLMAVVGDPGRQGRWDAPLDGKPAATQWRRLGHADGLSLVEARLITGRTHQLRRHAADAGYPLLGDRRHGGAAGRLWPRLALHAWRLRFPHPKTGAEVRVQSDPPDDLAPLFARIRPPEDA